MVEWPLSLTVCLSVFFSPAVTSPISALPCFSAVVLISFSLPAVTCLMVEWPLSLTVCFIVLSALAVTLPICASPCCFASSVILFFLSAVTLPIRDLPPSVTTILMLLIPIVVTALSLSFIITEGSNFNFCFFLFLISPFNL